MHIVCPHCATSYAIHPANLGASGRTVRCSRCKETWLARPEDVIIESVATVSAMAEAGRPSQDALAAEWEAFGADETDTQPPVVDSPPIADDWGTDGSSAEPDWPSAVRNEEHGPSSRRQRQPWFRRMFRPWIPFKGARQSLVNLPTACAAMGALIVALLVWRADMVRLMPQTAGFYKMVGLDVNLRGLSFKDVKVSTETVEGKQVLVIEGAVVSDTRKTVDLPRLRFSVRDAQGAEIYAWNTVLEQSLLRPGERIQFKSRLASPPAEGRNIDIRFFNRRDIAGGSA
jgi:predicted Zn finger-like uncharacterized protein